MTPSRLNQPGSALFAAPEACTVALAHCSALVMRGGTHTDHERHMNGHREPPRLPHRNSLEENPMCKDNPNPHSLSTRDSENRVSGLRKKMRTGVGGQLFIALLEKKMRQ